jgi:hypothetical protein
MPEIEEKSAKPNQKKPTTATTHAKNNSTLCQVDIRPIKQFVNSKDFLLKNKPFCQMMLAEKDFMSPEEFLAKLETWLNLLRQ